MGALKLSLCLLFLIIGGVPGVAEAQSAGERIARGRAAYESLDYEGAVAALESALEVPSISALERAEALEALTFALVVLDRERDAEARLRELFALDPYYVVHEPTGSPRIEALVTRVRSRVAPDAALSSDLDVRVELPRRARADQPVPVRVRVGAAGRTEVATVIVLYRGETDTEWTRREAQLTETTARERDYAVELAPFGRAERLEIYVEARDQRGRLLGRSAGPLLPAYLEVEEPTAGGGGGGENLAEAWWLWTIVGVVVVGAAVGIGVGVGTATGQAPDGTLPPGRVVLP